ncbi:hypothetical protein [Endozoicomonas sp. ONNA1]|uniref:hypothetical protein n=1 Tax=Endozoicomonas sp. ONNA1 TaxID=2828740 RepID=UPI002147A489|nr:hypothetical protein [Endozoicomonas sp. ONNA1]
MGERYKVICPCGYKAEAYYREKDNPYSSWGIWTFEGLKCSEKTVQKKMQMYLSEGLAFAGPVCPKCDRKVTEEDVKEEMS